MDLELPDRKGAAPDHCSKAFEIDGKVYATTLSGRQVLYQTGGQGMVLGREEATTTAILWEWEDARWSRVGSMSFPKRAHPTIVPLQNGRYLVMDPPHESDGKRTFGAPIHALFGIARLSEQGHFEMQSYGDLGIKGALSDRNIQAAFALMDASVLTDDMLTVACPEYGTLWSFSLRNGALRRSACMFETPLEKLMAMGSTGAIMLLNMQPLKDGTLLLSARDGEILQALAADLKKARSATGQLTSTGVEPGQVRRVFDFQNRQKRDVYVQYPFLRWFSYEPETGHVRKLNPAPPGAPELLHTKADADNFFWLPDEQGRVRVLDHGLKGLSQSPTPSIQLKPR